MRCHRPEVKRSLKSCNAMRSTPMRRVGTLQILTKLKFCLGYIDIYRSTHNILINIIVSRLPRVLENTEASVVIVSGTLAWVLDTKLPVS